MTRKVLDFLFGGISGERERKGSPGLLEEQQALDCLLSISMTKKQTMTNEGAKRNVPHLLQAQQALVSLWTISERRSNAKSSTETSPSQPFPGGYVGL